MWLKLVTMVLCQILLLQIAIARIVDPLYPPDPLLDSLATALDEKGIDVRRGQSSGLFFEAVRPQLAPLKTVPVNWLLAAGMQTTNPFTLLFNAGAFTDAYLVAVKKKGARPNPSDAEFRTMWDAASMENRLFLSFSGADLKYAEQVRDALRAHGYVVFLYKDNSSKYPKTNSVEVGRYFQQAGQHLVIDSSQARLSKGVMAEVLALRTLVRGSLARGESGIPGVGEERTSSAGNDRNGTPCCKLCTYRNGVQVGCGMTQCGPQCYGATGGPMRP